jgi:DNA-binding GntR family transcriptional regulator
MAQERDGLLPPRYQQVADDLRAKISDGRYPVGARLPTKPTLMEHYGVALGTLDKAIEVLRRAGLVETQQGSGMYVREPAPEHDAAADQVAELRQELDELRQRIGRIEASLATLTGQPRGGKREQAKTAASGGRQ